MDSAFRHLKAASLLHDNDFKIELQDLEDPNKEGVRLC